MLWLKPKTDWKATDYFNKEDYNRIATNLKYIKEFAKKFATRIMYLVGMGNKTAYTQFLTPAEVNNFQTNLHEVNDKTLQLDIGEDTQYRPEGATPDYNQWNRIEEYTLELHNRFVNSLTCTRLTQKLGNADSRRGIRI